MLKILSARFARGINHCSAPAAPFCLYTLSRSRIPANQLTTGGARQNDGGYPNDIFPRFFRQRDVRKFGPRDAVFTSIQRRSTGVDFSPLEQANKSLLHALTVVGFIRFPLATRMRRLSKPKLHSYSVFPCARLAVAAVRVVELQLRRSLDRFGGPSLRHRACGA